MLAELIVAMAPQLERGMRLKYRINAEDAEDVVCEAFRRFWVTRERYDGKRSLKAYLYRFADNVAKHLVARHLAWQKARVMEVQADEKWLHQLPGPEVADAQSEPEQPKEICRAVQSALDSLNKVERLVIEAYALADDVEIDAGELGLEIGKQCDGVPIPAGTIRQNKRRAKEKVAAELGRHGFTVASTGEKR